MACTLRCRAAEVAMSASRRRFASYIPLMLAAALSSFGCDDETTGRGRGFGPSTLRPQAAVSLQRQGAVNVQRGEMVQPTFIEAARTTSAFCPARPPFFAPFTVVFDDVGRSDLTFSVVEAQFVDTLGVVGGLMTLGPTDLPSRFGSTALPAFGSRAFPFSLPFGCAGHPTGTLNVVVVTADSRGQRTSTTLRTAVR